MKGIELPISTLIIIIIAVIVLVAMIALLGGVWPSAPQAVNLGTAKDSACSLMASTGCSLSTTSIAINNFDADKDGTLDGGTGGAHPNSCAVAVSDNLGSLCACYYNSLTEEDCKSNICGCLRPSP